MTDTAELKRMVQSSGLKYRFIANQLGITPYALQKKINNITEFKAGEITILCKLLNITNKVVKEEIFFANDV